MAHVGLALPFPHPLPVHDYLEAAVRAEAAGYTTVWIPEIAGPDAVSLAGAAVVGTKKIRVGTAIIPVYTRHPTLAGITAATLNSLSSGRFVLGLGVSSHTIIQDWQGISFSKPLRRIREYVEIVRRVTAGEKTVFDGEIFHIHNYRPAMVVSYPKVPIYVAALNPPMLRLAGAVADGVILNWVPAAQIPTLMQEVAAGAKQAGRSLAEVEICCMVRVSVDEDEAKVKAWLRRELTGYTVVELYNRYFSRLGFAEEARNVRLAWQQGDRAGALTQVSERMLHEMAVFGSAATCREKITAFHRVGVQEVIAFPFSPDPQPSRALLHTVSTLLA